MVAASLLLLTACTAPNPNLVPGQGDAEADTDTNNSDGANGDVTDEEGRAGDTDGEPEGDTPADTPGPDGNNGNPGDTGTDGGDMDGPDTNPDADPDAPGDTNGEDTDPDADPDMGDPDADDPDASPDCNANLCADPAPRCANDTSVEQRWSGACDDGVCLYDTEETECAAGCCDGGCCEVTPANIGRFGRIQTTGRNLEAPDEFHTEDDCRLDGPLGVCAVTEPAQGVSACVCRVDNLEIDDLRVDGPHALVILASGAVVVSGRLDISADATAPGPGARPAYSAVATERHGGSGASFGTHGGRAPGGERAAVRGTANLEPLEAGAHGQSACEVRGGGGAGALQITAAVSLDIAGEIRAGGGGGAGGDDGLDCNGGAGGGSGGAVLLEAPEVEISGVIWAAGGGGGSGGVAPGNDSRSGRRGEDASPGRNPAEGGEARTKDGCGLDTITSGGGGYGAVGSLEAGNGGGGDFQSCLLEQHSAGDGGAGGGLGRVRINSLSGCDCGGNIEPNPSLGQLGVR